MKLKKEEILGVGITSEKKDIILKYITKSLQDGSKKYYIVTPNPEIIVYSHHHPSFKKILNGAELSLADGIGIILSSLILKRDIKERATGVDMMDKICEIASSTTGSYLNRIVTVGFLGGRDGVAKKAAECLVKKYPKLQVGFVGEEWNNDFVTGPAARSSQSAPASLAPQSGAANADARFGSPSLASPAVSKRIDILFVGFGFPKQEEWIANNLPHIPVKIAMTVGGSFDIISGNIPRSPKWMRRMGLEWLFRLVRQPWRIKRQLSLLEFIYLVLKEAFKNNPRNNPENTS